MFRFAYLYKQNDMNGEAEKMYGRALDGQEKVWGPNHTSTLDTVNNLGTLYADQYNVEVLLGYQRIAS